MMKKSTQEEIEMADLVTLSVITTSLAQFLLERSISKKKIYTKQLKYFGNKYLQELIKSEELILDKIIEIDEDKSDSQTTEVQEGIRFLSQCGFVGFILANRFNKAYNYNPKEVMDVIDKIIKENESTR